MERGYIQLYTGNGKGKTTAALGQAMRAVGAGLRVFIGQFVKGMHYSELDSLKDFSDHIEIKQFGRDCFIFNAPTSEDCARARDGLKEIEAIIHSGRYQMVILDEVNIATYYNLFTVEDLLQVLTNKPPEVEIVLTGRMADPRIVDIADLVTEMKEIKHYYQQGVQARAGIEK